LIDVGTDGYIIDEINKINTGVGKKRVSQVIITHEHFDHAGGIKAIRDEFTPTVYAYKKIPGVDEVVKDFMKLRIGDQDGTIISIPGHSNDSICIYCEEDKTLFSGDTPLLSNRPEAHTYASMSKCWNFSQDWISRKYTPDTIYPLPPT
jgi:glyoxylase-like metal-dependent hydrolase (beta-lactamase superfamily II)